MKYFGIILVAAVVFLSGCESFKGRVGEKVHGPTYQQRVYAVDQKAAYDAVTVVVKKMGFINQKGGANQGWVEANTRIASDSSFRGASQTTVKVKFSPDFSNEGTVVAVAFVETIHDNSDRGWAGSGSQQVRDSAIYGMFFQNLAEALSEAKNATANQ